MAAYKNCTISRLGGDDPRNGGPSPAVRQMGDCGSVCDSSPLQNFGTAKKKMDEIFVEIGDYVGDTVTCMQSAQQVGITVKCGDAVERNIANVRTIRDILSRSHMKVAFLGRTSNGKSSVINAMLHKKILPSDYGHTTNCFVQLEGSDSRESYLVIEGSTVKQNVESVEQLANALYNGKLDGNKLVHICWPKQKCLLLREDVVFVDSPGIDIEDKFDERIYRYCLDSDVFVYVANAQATLTRAEKNFFREVLKRVAKPNIFILNNHWDVVVCGSDNLDQVQAQHMERAVEFLVTELNMCTQSEANQRIFFVSAKEALQARLQEERELPAQIGALVDGFPKRYSDFQDFEQKFKECISNSAVRTKFEELFQRGKDIVSEIQQIIYSICDQAQQLKIPKAVAKKEIHDKMNMTERQLLLLTQQMKDKIQEMVEDVEQKVSTALSEEIRHLPVLVDEFHFPFQQSFLNKYKSELLHHVENELGSKLLARLSAELEKSVEKSRREMTERMSCLLPAEKKNALPQQERFEIIYRLNCNNICADFHEVLDFSRGAGGVMSVIGAGQGNDLIDAVEAGGAKVAEELTEDRGTSLFGKAAALGGLAFTGLVLAPAKAVRTVTKAAVGALFGPQNDNDHAKWNNEAKEMEFKRQFVAHVTKKQQIIIESTSADCSEQVEQALSSTFQLLRDLVSEALNDMDAEIKTLDKEIKELEEAANPARDLQNKAKDITEQLEEFYDAFLELRN